jgi:hypothetical protein
MSLALARFVATLTTRSTGVAFTATTIQGYYDVARKPSPLVVHTTSGSPLVSNFQLKAAGTWLIVANSEWAGASSLAICRNGIAQANRMAKSGSVTNPNVTLMRELNYSDNIQVAWTTPAAAMVQASEDQNFISFEYLGPQ